MGTGVCKETKMDSGLLPLRSPTPLILYLDVNDTIIARNTTHGLTAEEAALECANKVLSRRPIVADVDDATVRLAVLYRRQGLVSITLPNGMMVHFLRSFIRLLHALQSAPCRHPTLIVFRTFGDDLPNVYHALRLVFGLDGSNRGLVWKGYGDIENTPAPGPGIRVHYVPGPPSLKTPGSDRDGGVTTTPITMDFGFFVRNFLHSFHHHHDGIVFVGLRDHFEAWEPTNPSTGKPFFRLPRQIPLRELFVDDLAFEKNPTQPYIITPYDCDPASGRWVEDHRHHHPGIVRADLHTNLTDPDYLVNKLLLVRGEGNHQ